MRRTATVALVAVFLLLSLLPAGCGTVHVNLHTTVKPSGDLIQQFKVEGSGMMSASLASPEVAEDFRKEGWQVTVERSADSASLIATKNFKLGEPVLIPSLLAAGEEAPAPERTRLRDLAFDVRDRIVLKEYFFQMTLPRSPAEATATEVEDEFAELGKSMEEALKAMFSMSWTLSLPGQIVETNADATEGSSATWYFDFDSLEEDRYMMVRTRQVNWPIVGGLIAIIPLAIAGSGAFVLIRRRRANVDTP